MSNKMRESLQNAYQITQKALIVAVTHKNILENHETRTKRLEDKLPTQITKRET
jgi:hypothetical protein